MEVEVLKEVKVLEKLNIHELKLLKEFKVNAQITTYHFKSHKSNYLIITAETNTHNIIGLTIIFKQKPFKSLGEIALGSLNTLIFDGSILAME